MSKNNTPDLSHLASRWPSTLVARSEISNFTGGAINSRTLANLDSKGKGPPGRIKIGKKVAYKVSSLIFWLEHRSEVL
jgi:hypothetical protein